MITFIVLFALFLWLIVFGFGALFVCGFWVIDVIVGIAIVSWLFKIIFGKKK